MNTLLLIAWVILAVYDLFERVVDFPDLIHLFRPKTNSGIHAARAGWVYTPAAEKKP